MMADIVYRNGFLIMDTPLCQQVADLLQGCADSANGDNIEDKGTWALVSLWNPHMALPAPEWPGLRIIGIAQHGSWMEVGVELEAE